MKRLAAFFLLAIGAVYAYNGYLTDDYTVLAFWEWIQSLFTRAELKASSYSSQNVADIAADFIAGQEGFRSKTYLDIAGLPTIGYGHKLVPGDGFTMASTISEADAKNLLIADMQNAINCVESSLTSAATPNQEAAMVSLCFNIGCAAFRGSSVLRAFNNGDPVTASADFALWNKAHVGGILQTIEDLVSRRSSEQELFNA